MNKQISALLIMPILLISCRTSSQENEQLAQDPTLFTRPETGNQYFLSKIGTWEEAQSQAEAAGGHLVIIEDEKEQAWLIETFQSQDSSGYLAGELRPSPLAFWIGLSDRQVEGEFRWVNGEPLSYQNFAPGEPNNTTPEGKEEDFVALALDPSYNPVIGYWNDGNQERGQVRGIIEIEQQNLPD